jgi:hypothetical protein
MTKLKTQIEFDTNLARWLNVQEVALVREDLLPDGGGKKRRALEHFAQELEGVKHIHLLSYAGSHTAFTLAKLLPEVMIYLYGTHYGGGSYEKAMVSQLNTSKNIIQKVGTFWAMSLEFNRQKRRSGSGHHFMRIGGSLGPDMSTQSAVKETIGMLGEEFHHVVAVASGDLITTISKQTPEVTGVLTQPLAIRILKYFRLNKASGIWKPLLRNRIHTIREVNEMTGQTWDPVFMGTLFSYLKTKKNLPPKLCIWITCPTGIDW